jgi:hypothetical protein
MDPMNICKTFGVSPLRKEINLKVETETDFTVVVDKDITLKLIRDGGKTYTHLFEVAVYDELTMQV